MLDVKDIEILTLRRVHRAALKGPLVGDYVIVSGQYRRIAHDWGDDVQLTTKADAGSFYFGCNGQMDFSGGLDLPMPKACLIETNEWRSANAWFFHHNEQRAHNGVTVLVECRVYRFDWKAR